MSIELHFTGMAGPLSGRNNDGVLFGTITPVAPNAVLSGFQANIIQAVLRGNADAAGAVTYTDISVAAREASEGDTDTFAFFDTINPSADELLIDTAGRDVVAVHINVKTVGVLTGSQTPRVDYWDGSQFVQAQNVVMAGSFSATGIARITFTRIAGIPTWPAGNGITGKWIRIKCPSVTAVTTPPVLSGLWAIHTHDQPTYSDITAVVAQTSDSPSFTTLPGQVNPYTGDIVWYICSQKFCKLAIRTFLPADPSYTKEIVYWNGTEATPLTASDPSRGVTAEVGTYILAFAPPGDWEQITLIDSAGTSHTGYAIGYRVTSTASIPIPPARYTLKAYHIEGSNTSGIPAQYMKIEKVTIHANGSALSDSRFLICNRNTGESEAVTLPVNNNVVTTSVELPTAATDGLVILQLTGHHSVNVDDCTIILTP